MGSEMPQPDLYFLLWCMIKKRVWPKFDDWHGIGSGSLGAKMAAQHPILWRRFSTMHRLGVSPDQQELLHQYIRRSARHQARMEGYDRTRTLEENEELARRRRQKSNAQK